MFRNRRQRHCHSHEGSVGTSQRQCLVQALETQLCMQWSTVCTFGRRPRLLTDPISPQKDLSARCGARRLHTLPRLPGLPACASHLSTRCVARRPRMMLCQPCLFMFLIYLLAIACPCPLTPNSCSLPSARATDSCHFFCDKRCSDQL